MARVRRVARMNGVLVDLPIAHDTRPAMHARRGPAPTLRAIHAFFRFEALRRMPAAKKLRSISAGALHQGN
jgi:hypothetical protein